MNDVLIFIIIFSGIFTLIGSVFFIVGIIMINHIKKKKKKCSAKTYGKVTDIVENKIYNENDGYISSGYLVFEYNIGEIKFEKENPLKVLKSKYEIGQDIEVYYNPEDYSEYYIELDSFQKNIALIFTSIGIGAIIIAIVISILIL